MDTTYDFTGLKYGLGLAAFVAIAGVVGRAIEDVVTGRTISVVDPGTIGIGLGVGLAAFFSGWISFHWTRKEKRFAVRVSILSVLVTLLTLFGPVLLGGVLTLGYAFALAGGVFAFLIPKFGLATFLAALAWSSFFLRESNK